MYYCVHEMFRKPEDICLQLLKIMQYIYITTVGTSRYPRIGKSSPHDTSDKNVHTQNWLKKKSPVTQNLTFPLIALQFAPYTTIDGLRQLQVNDLMPDLLT